VVVRRTGTLLILTAFSLALGACAGQESAPAPPPLETTSGRRQPAGALDGIEAARHGLLRVRGTESPQRDLGARATLRKGSHLFVERDVAILTRRPGIVRNVEVARGARVLQGASLCALENRDLALAVEVARLDVEKARAAFERAGRLDGESAISKEAYEETEFRLKSSQRTEEIAEQELEKSFVRAPFDGVVSARNVEIRAGPCGGRHSRPVSASRRSVRSSPVSTCLNGPIPFSVLETPSPFGRTYRPLRPSRAACAGSTMCSMPPPAPRRSSWRSPDVRSVNYVPG